MLEMAKNYPVSLYHVTCYCATTTTITSHLHSIKKCGDGEFIVLEMIQASSHWYMCFHIVFLVFHFVFSLSQSWLNKSVINYLLTWMCIAYEYHIHTFTHSFTPRNPGEGFPQYIVEPPFALIASNKWLWKVLTSFWLLFHRIFTYSYRAKDSSSLWFIIFPAAITFFKSYQIPFSWNVKKVTEKVNPGDSRSDSLPKVGFGWLGSVLAIIVLLLFIVQLLPKFKFKFTKEDITLLLKIAWLASLCSRKTSTTSSLTHFYAWPWGSYSSGQKLCISCARQTTDPYGQTVPVHIIVS